MIIKIRQKVVILLAGVLLWGLSACSGFAYDGPTPTPQGLAPVVSELRDLYHILGGEKDL
jgi:hypothetical protein